MGSDSKLLRSVGDIEVRMKVVEQKRATRKGRSDRTSSIFAQAPCRADLAGSTLDLWPLYLFHPGAVTINFAVNVLTTCRIVTLHGKEIRLRSADAHTEERFRNLDQLCQAKQVRHQLAARLLQFFQPDEGLLLETNSESPAGAGIAGSSAMMIATAAALARLTGRTFSRDELRIVAQNIEAQVIRVPTGCQDYYPALYGGVNAVELSPDGIHRQSIAVPAEEIEARFVLCYTGAPRKSGINNWAVFKAHINGNRHVHRNFAEIAEIACELREALGNADWREVGRLLRREWKLRRTNAPGISTPFIEKLIAAAQKQGSVAAKVCGAGGGGCVVFLTENGARDRVSEVLRRTGAKVLPFRVSREGLSVTSLQS
jgi:D-glycero-alpha-D-manno-heptose-7-phosphate kinase